MTITCPGCEKKLIIPDANPPRVRCRSCKTIFSIEYSEPATISDIRFPFKVKVKRTWKKHKGKIIAGVGVAIAGAVGTALYRNSKNNSSEESAPTNTLPPDLSGVTDSVTAGLQTAGTILSNACVNAVTEITSGQPDRYDLAVDPFATGDDEDEEFPEDDNMDLSDLEYSPFLEEKCPRCGTPLHYGFYTSPWEDGDNEYGYWTCSRCGKIVYDWASGDDD